MDKTTFLSKLNENAIIGIDLYTLKKQNIVEIARKLFDLKYTESFN